MNFNSTIFIIIGNKKNERKERNVNRLTYKCTYINTHEYGSHKSILNGIEFIKVDIIQYALFRKVAIVKRKVLFFIFKNMSYTHAHMDNFCSFCSFNRNEEFFLINHIQKHCIYDVECGGGCIKRIRIHSSFRNFI